MSSTNIKLGSTKKVFPSRPQSETTTALSIVDNTVVKFARCAAIWYFEASPKHLVTHSILQKSLSEVLNSYPHFGGRLTWRHESSATSPYRRAQVTFNSQNDIGVPLLMAISAQKLSDFTPKAIHNQVRDKIEASSAVLLPSTPLAFSRENLLEDSPNVIIQHTTFSCGGTAISVSITHGLSDAQTLSNFVNDWAAISRALVHGHPLPTIDSIFDPRLLDARAAGDITADCPDPAILNAARQLPMHRFDWYIQHPLQPWGDLTPPDFPRHLDLSPSVRIPWEQWDVSLPIASRVFHLTAEDLQKIHDLAGLDVTKHDALIAHLWSKISIARQKENEAESHLNISLGLRRRLDLSDKFVGSPIILGAVSSASTSPAVLAEKINSTIKQFDMQSIGNLLHDEAFEVCPQRLWRGCLGRDHVMVTSWVRSGVGKVDFGDETARWIEPVMSPLDGLCAITDGIGSEGRWKSGVDIWVSLERDVMEKFIDGMA